MRNIMSGRTLTSMKTHKPLDLQQPDWVCRDCGGQWGLWWDGGRYSGPPHHCATFHNGRCGVCSKQTGVTEPRDYGGLKEGWHKPLVE
jgi:hypothetical protein